MVAAYEKTAVKTIQVERARLARVLNQNLETHRSEYAEAMEGYASARHDAMLKIQAAADAAVSDPSKATYKAFREANRAFTLLKEPRDHSESYVQAIALMEWETRDVIELSINDFECYVQDNWEWSYNFKNVSSMYNGS